MDRELARIRNYLSGGRRVRALTGAGISAESGVPTFRGAGGLWENHRPEDLATPEAFERDPALVWKWYDWRRGVCAKAAPNPGHKVLAALEKRSKDFWLITQNVDGLHQLAGSRNVLPLHGDIWRMRCTSCGNALEDRTNPLPKLPPVCGGCGEMLRPDIVWFGESLPSGILQKAITVSQDAELFLVIGTKGVVEPAASMARLAKMGGALVVEVNPEPSSLSGSIDIALQGKAGEVLPKLLGARPGAGGQ